MAYMMVIAHRCLCRFHMVSHQIVMIDTNFIYDACSTEKIISRVEQHLAICFMVSIFRHQVTMIPQQNFVTTQHHGAL